MPNLLHQRIGAYRWHGLPEWLPVLLGPEGLRWSQWRGEGRLQVVKEAPHRAVYRVELPERTFYVKHYRCPRLGDVARQLVQPCAAEREFHKTAEVGRRGIATVRPMAWGCRFAAGLARDSFLVSEALHDTCTLRDYYEHVLPRHAAGARAQMRRQLIERVARFAAAIHQAGVLHRDFHAGNVLVAPATCPAGAPSDAEELTLYLIDLLNVRLAGPLNCRASCRNLAVLESAWLEDLTSAERWRFWKTYRAGRPELAPWDLVAGADEVHRLAREHCLRIHRQRDKRTLRTNRDFFGLRTPVGEAHGVAVMDREELAHWLLAPDEPLWRNLHRPVKLGHSGVVVTAELPLEGTPSAVAMKRARPRSWWKAVTGLWRASRSRRGWCAGHALLQRGIATPRPVALCEPSRPLLRRSTYLATEWIEGAENLHLWGWRIAGLPAHQRWRLASRCAESAGRLVGRLHGFGISHGDLKGSNLLVAERGGQVGTWLADVEGIRIGRQTNGPRLRADLARLAVGLEAHPWVSRTVVCRFVQAYVGELPRPRPDWKEVWRSVARLSGRLRSSKRRREGPVL